MEFNGKRVLVTGGSRGIGAAVAAAFAERGGRVAITWLGHGEAAERVRDRLPGGPHLALRCDVADPTAVETVIERVTMDLGGLDILVNNAGVFSEHPPEEIDYRGWQEAWHHILGVNLVGPANACYWAARWMIDHGGGRIVNVSSRGAFRGEPDAPAYGASKAGLNALSQSLARRLARHGISVGVVAPGWVETDMAASYLAGPQGDEIRRQSPLGRVATPEEVAQAVLFLAADECEFATGAIIDVNGASYLRS